MGVKVREKIKGSGDWYVFTNHKGFRGAKQVGSYVAAVEVAEKLEAMLVLKDFGIQTEAEQKAPTLNIYSQIYIEETVAGVLDDATHERYGEVFKRDILPAMGNMPIDEITPKIVRNLLNKLARDKRTSKSISLTRTVLSTCLTEAVIDGYLKTNPVKDLAQNRKRHKTVEARRPRTYKVNPLNTNEVKQFLDIALADDPDMYGPMFLCDFRTGLRLGELIALHWDDIEWDNNVINVRRSFRKSNKNGKGKWVQKVKPLKDGEERQVDMSTQLKEVLFKLLKKRKFDAAKSGSWNPSAIIFHYKGHYRAQNTVRKAFKELLKKARLREIRVHDMRHTYASLLISNGVSLAYIRDQLGHSSIKTTVDIYGHLIPRSMQHVVNELDNASNDTLKK